MKNEDVLIDRGVGENCGMRKNKWLRVKYVSLRDSAFQSKRTAKANPHVINVVRIKRGIKTALVLKELRTGARTEHSIGKKNNTAEYFPNELST